MKKHILSMSCAVSALVLSGGGAYAAAAGAAATAADTSPGTTIGELVVTAERREENLQDTPIAVSAFSGDTLKSKRLDGGQNLILQIPNTNYTRSNFGGFNLKIRGIGVDVVSYSGTTGVSINENELPVAANNFANTDFFDTQRVEVVRGPQGTLYGRNAVGGAVDIITNKPTDSFGGYASAEYGNYNTIRVQGAVNIPIGDALALRVAGFRLTQDGFGENLYLNQRVDGRDLGAIRTTLSFKPSDRFSAYLMYEHYGEDDNRNRIGKQLCIKDQGPSSVGGVPIAPAGGPIFTNYAAFLNQGCVPGSLYQDAAYGTVNSNATFLATGNLFGLNNGTDVFANHPMQNHNLHDIESVVQPNYKVNQDLVDLHMEYRLTDNLTLTSITGYNRDVASWSEDYNRLVPLTPFTPTDTGILQLFGLGGIPLLAFPNGVVNDPQTGHSNLFTTFDLSTAESKEYTQELRLQSSFTGPLNFSAGAFYSEVTSNPGANNYYVMSNALTASAIINNIVNGALLGGPVHIDPNFPPDGSGHNYYDARSGGGYLKSYAAFGEIYYNIVPTLKLTLGGRYTVDQLLNISYPISVLVGVPNGTPLFPNTTGNPFFPDGGVGGFPDTICTTSAATCLIPQKVTYREFTGRANLDWTPTLSFTDKSLFYASYSRGYKGGGFNTPCQAALGTVGAAGASCGYPLAYNPEFINAFEIGTKNTLDGGKLTLNGDAFYYDYKGYQVSTIVAKSSVNLNINAKIYGAEFESVFEPIRNLALNANIGYLHTSIDNGQSQVDQINLTQGNPNFTLIHEADGTACLAPTALLAAAIAGGEPAPFLGGFAALGIPNICDASGALKNGVPVDLGGKQLPNTPKFTVSVGAQYVFELPHDWLATVRGDWYWQDDSFARIFNAINDQLRGYSVTNATLTFSNVSDGLDVQFFVKNAFNAQPITGTYLTNDTSGLFQNVFTLDPRTFGVQLTKKF